MKQLTVLLLLFAAVTTRAQQTTHIDTVVVRPDSTFESRIHRLLYNQRTNVKYHLEHT
jgi:hypothetical protein